MGPPLVIADDVSDVRIRLADGSITVVHDPMARADSVVWVENRFDAQQERAISVSDIQRMEERRLDPYGTTLTILGVASALAMAVILAVTCSDRSGEVSVC
jgi:hypothetical protein